jgi:hypothetical protein
MAGPCISAPSSPVRAPHTHAPWSSRCRPPVACRSSRGPPPLLSAIWRPPNGPPLHPITASPIKATERRCRPFRPFELFSSIRLRHELLFSLSPLVRRRPPERHRRQRNRARVPPSNPLPDEHHPRSSSCHFAVPLTLLLHLRCCRTLSVTTGATPTIRTPQPPPPHRRHPSPVIPHPRNLAQLDALTSPVLVSCNTPCYENPKESH